MKKLLALTLALVMVLALCACGAKEEAAPAPEAAPAAPAEAAPAAPAAPAEAAPAAPEGEASGEPSAEPSGEPSGPMAAAEADYEITVDGVTGMAHYEDTDNGDQATKSWKISFNGVEFTGTIDKGVWTADDAANQAVTDAVKAAFEGNNVVGPQA